MSHIFQVKSLRSKMMLPILSLMGFGVILLTFFLVERFTALQSKTIEQWVISATDAQAKTMAGHLGNFVAQTRTMAQLAEELEKNPDALKAKELDDVAKKILATSHGIQCVYFMFVRGAYFSPSMTQEGMYHNFAWYQTPNGPARDGDPGGFPIGHTPADDYFRIPERTGHEAITNPYYYRYTGSSDSLLVASFTYPIFIKGHFAGIAGMDLTLKDIWKDIVSKNDLTDGAYAFLVANNGFCAAHPKPEAIGTIVGSKSDIPDSSKKALLNAIQQGNKFWVETPNQATGILSRLSFSPIQIGNTGTPWSLGTVFSMTTILEPVFNLRNLALLVSLIILVALGFLIFWVSSSIAKPV
ncbi:MAG TPA: hypothetical protein VLM37_11085, partial [Fibrobacteraceae bacterium]|nr:hypothetical protein [Fibrobacteraceae bacterium]